MVRRLVVLFSGSLALAIAAAVGCSTFSDADPPANDGGAGEASANDAGDPRHFCERQSPNPTLCDDFDENAPLGQKWTFTYRTDAGSIAVDTTTPDAATSAPGSLLAAIAPLAQGEEGEASIRRDLPNGTTDVDLSFMMRVESLDRSLVVASIRTGTTAAFYQAELTLQNGTAATFEEFAVPGFGDASSFSKAHDFATPDYLGSFTYVRIHLSFGSQPHATYFFGNPTTPLVDTDFTPTVASGGISVAIGTVYTTGKSAGAKVRFDDVVIRSK